MAEQVQALAWFKEEVDGKSGFQHEYFTEREQWGGRELQLQGCSVNHEIAHTAERIWLM